MRKLAENRASYDDYDDASFAAAAVSADADADADENGSLLNLWLS